MADRDPLVQILGQIQQLPSTDLVTGAKARAHGGEVLIDYIFDTATAAADPGDGMLRLQNATQNISTAIRADALDIYGTDFHRVLGDMAASTSAIKGYIRLVHSNDPNKWILFSFADSQSQSGWRNLLVTVLASSTTNPFANADPVTLFYMPRDSERVVIDIYGTAGSPHTWTKPRPLDGVKSIQVILIGGGGGGGSGRKGDSFTARSGGSGGGGGAYTEKWFPDQVGGVAIIANTETVTVGAGGAGGAAQTTANTNGTSGAAGGVTSFGTRLKAGGGSAGLSGATGVRAGGAGGVGLYSGGDGGDSGVGNGNAGETTLLFSAAGGGAGGGADTVPADTVGGAGGDSSSAVLPTALQGGTGGVGATNTAATAGESSGTNNPFGGAGGGGGGADGTSANATARPGKNGGAFGGGGGGGAVGIDAIDSGEGGDGSDGIAVIATYR